MRREEQEVAPLARHRAQLAIGGCAPSPRKDSAEPSRITCPKRSVVKTKIAERQWRQVPPDQPRIVMPMARAASI
jgi:hypothetical protein